jgi:type I restriction enzyme, R subunit
MSKFTEQEVEDLTLEWLGELGWRHVYGPDIEPEKPKSERDSFSTVYLADRLKVALKRLNPALPNPVLEDAFNQITRPESPDLLTNNRTFHLALTGTVKVPYRNTEGEETTADVILVDWENQNPDANEFLAINQFTVIEQKYLDGYATPAREHNRRPDVVLFVNGLPLAVIEIKNPADSRATVERAFEQIQTYKSQITSLFTYNELCVISDGLDARMGTISSDWERFMPWRAIEKPIEGKGDLRTLLYGVFEKKRFLDLIRHFIVFEDTRKGPIKKVAGYHQFHAVNTALQTTILASREGSNGRAGVVWHTQGSGKSLTMVYFTGKAILSKVLENPTIVVVTDRIDLDDQLYGTYAACKDLLRQTPVQADSRTKIRELLDRKAGGVIFTTIQKFFPEKDEERFPTLTDRHNVIVIADEAHRSQYGLEARLIHHGDKAGTFAEGYAMHMRHALPNASFLAFTGTPINLKSASTTQVFGDVISIYDVKRAVDDRATVPIYYEGRFAKLSLDEEHRPRIDPEFEEITEGEEETAREKLKREWAATEALVCEPKRLQQVAEDLIHHWFLRQEAFLDKPVEGNGGKAMIVCMSRRIAVELYDRLIKLRPDWESDHDEQGVLKVVISGQPAMARDSKNTSAAESL